MLCLYRRNHRLDPKNCFYKKYLCSTNQQFHKKFIFAQNESKKKNQHFPDIDRNASQGLSVRNQEKKSKTYVFEEPFTPSVFEFFEHRFQKFYENVNEINHPQRVYQVNNDKERELRFQIVNNPPHEFKNEYEQNEKLNLALSNISNIIGELELQIGIECVRNGLFVVSHFLQKKK